MLGEAHVLAVHILEVRQHGSARLLLFLVIRSSLEAHEVLISLLVLILVILALFLFFFSLGSLAVRWDLIVLLLIEVLLVVVLIVVVAERKRLVLILGLFLLGVLFSVLTLFLFLLFIFGVVLDVQDVGLKLLHALLEQADLKLVVEHQSLLAEHDLLIVADGGIVLLVA